MASSTTMNMRPTFDTAKFQTTLTDGGVPEAQARAQTVALNGALDEAMADVVHETALERLESRLNAQFERSRTEFDKLRSDLHLEIAQTRTEFSEKLRLQGWAIVGTNAALLAAAVALIKFTP
ncbi:MAG: hypothetical protein IT546_00310 [Caulobacteraceae bacterium]|nr:hypothetical protein [Caulobacteraceae bacterium]